MIRKQIIKIYEYIKVHKYKYIIKLYIEVIFKQILC